jgi:hypothetical protein
MIRKIGLFLTFSAHGETFCAPPDEYIQKQILTHQE